LQVNYKRWIELKRVIDYAKVAGVDQRQRTTVAIGYNFLKPSSLTIE
jgi:hypothetical protein